MESMMTPVTRSQKPTYSSSGPSTQERPLSLSAVAATLGAPSALAMLSADFVRAAARIQGNAVTCAGGWQLSG